MPGITLGGSAGAANVNASLTLTACCRRREPRPARRLLNLAYTRKAAVDVPIMDRSAAAACRQGVRLVMKHAASRELYAYWEAQRGTRPAPERAEIEPSAIRGALGDVFILAIDAAAGHPVRLAGTRVCALFGREIKGEAFLDLWSPSSRNVIDSLLAILADEYVGTVAGVTAQSGVGEAIELELLALPLGWRRPSFARAIGVLAPLEVPQWLGTSPIGALTLGGRRHLGASIKQRLLPRFMATRGRRGLRVYQGGRS